MPHIIWRLSELSPSFLCRTIIRVEHLQYKLVWEAIVFSDVDFVPLFLGTRTKLMIGADWGGNIDAVFFRYKWVGVLSSKLIMECEAEETVEDRASADEQQSWWRRQSWKDADWGGTYVDGVVACSFLRMFCPARSSWC